MGQGQQASESDWLRVKGRGSRRRAAIAIADRPIGIGE